MSSMRASRGAGVLLALLIATDLAFCAIHLLHVYSPVANDWLFSIQTDRSYAELFQYIKLFWLVLLLAGLTLSHKAFAYLGWTALFVYLLIDDIFRVHESVGLVLAASLGLPSIVGLRPRDLGELLVSGVAGAALLTLIGLGYLWSTPAQKALSVRLGLLLGMLVFFGVLVDMLHVIVMATPGWSVALALLEDGGEMLTVSVMVRAALQHWLDVSGAATIPDRGRRPRGIGPP